jgi:hypothetical protein
MAMSTILTKDELKKFGLEGVVFGEKTTIEIPPDVPEGKALPLRDIGPAIGGAIFGMNLILPGLLSPAPRKLDKTSRKPALEEPLELGYENPWGAKFFLIKGKGLMVECEDFEFEAVPIDDRVRCKKDPKQNRLFALVEGEGRCIFRVMDGGVVVRVGTEAVEFEKFHRKPKPVPLFEPVPVDLAPYLGMLSDPLKTMLVPYTATEWSRVVALGLILRYWMHGVKERIPTEKLLAGEVPQVVKNVREWREHLSEGQIKSIVEYAFAACTRLEIEIDDLDRHYSMRRSWIIRFVNLCVRRDDLEGVRWLIRSQELDERLKALDEVGWRFAVTVPPGLAPEEERLLWAGVHDPHAWWTRPIQPKKATDKVWR